MSDGELLASAIIDSRKINNKPYRMRDAVMIMRFWDVEDRMHHIDSLYQDHYASKIHEIMVIHANNYDNKDRQEILRINLVNIQQYAIECAYNQCEYYDNLGKLTKKFLNNEIYEYNRMNEIWKDMQSKEHTSLLIGIQMILKGFVLGYKKYKQLNK